MLLSEIDSGDAAVVDDVGEEDGDAVLGCVVFFGVEAFAAYDGDAAAAVAAAVAVVGAVAVAVRDVAAEVVAADVAGGEVEVVVAVDAGSDGWAVGGPSGSGSTMIGGQGWSRGWMMVHL